MNDLDVRSIESTNSVFATFDCLNNQTIEHREFEWLVEKGVRSVERRRHLVEVLANTGQHDDAGVCERHRLANAPRDFPTISAGHHDVEQHDLRQVLARESIGLIAIARLNDLVSARAKVLCHHRSHAWLVVCDEDHRLA